MTISRRWFLAAGGAAVATACGPKSAATTPPEAKPSTGPKRLLMLGGTGFLGPHVVEAALAAGHEVTLFNRGKTNPHLFTDLERLRGDRNGDVSALKGRTWDYVVDTSANIPRQVEATAGLLADGAERYLYVSSISAYAKLGSGGAQESGPTIPMPEPYSEALPEHYGALKAGSERAAEAAMPGRALVVRPGLIVGPGDPTDRFTYWPVRVQRGGPVLAPGATSDPTQYIDARDLAAWMVRALGEGDTGIFNATGPTDATTIGALLQACKAATASDAEFVWGPADFLEVQEVAPWMHMPVWVPPSHEEFGGMLRVSIDKALAAGLTFRPVAETIVDTLAWWREQPEERREAMRAGLPAERETEVLAALAERKSAA